MKQLHKQSQPEGNISPPFRLHPLTALFFLTLILGFLLNSCAPDLLSPPRLATETAEGRVTATPTGAPLTLRAPTPTGEPATVEEALVVEGANPTVTLWVNRTSPQYEAAVERMIDEFEDSHDIHVELVTVAPDMLPDLIKTAAVSPTYPLPDVVLLPLEYAVGWAEAGILDTSAAEAVVEELDPETFDQAALELVRTNGEVAAIPSDGWQQLLIYRSDWFEEKELEPPDDFDSILTAAEVISDRTNLIYSFNLATESSLRATTRRFEQLAIANGCQLVDEKGELLILEEQCQDALEFYRFLCNTYCPPGVQTDVSALNAYLAGRAGMIMAAPDVLPVVAGLDETYQPRCPECEEANFLAESTGVVTTLTGRGAMARPENLGQISYLGITTAADQEAADTFARYWFNEGYLEWLGVEPARKVPMRLGTAAEPTRFIDSWYELPMSGDGRTLSDIFGEETATLLASNLVNPDRWGYQQGEGALISDIYERRTLSILLQELLSGYYDSNRAAIEGYKRLVELIPDYEYYFDPEPTPEDE